MADELNDDGLRDDLTPAPAAPAAPPVDDSVRMTPQQFEQFKQRQRKGYQKQLADANARATAADALRGQVQELLDSGLLPDSAEFSDFTTATTETLTALMSDKERLELAEKANATKLTKAEQLAQSRWDKFKRARVFTEVAVEAQGKTKGPGALRTLQKEMLPYAIVADDEDGTVTFDMNVADENGHVTKQEVPAKRAVDLFEENVTDWGFLFNSASSGGGGDQVTVDGIPRTGQRGQIDVNSLTMEQFLELEQKHPQALEQAMQGGSLPQAQPQPYVGAPIMPQQQPQYVQSQYVQPQQQQAPAYQESADPFAGMDGDAMTVVTPYR